jgi:DNA-binding transcriptional LysR family regulator
MAIEHDDFVRRTIGQQQMIPVAAAAHPLAQSPEPVPASLVREHFQIALTDLTEHTSGQDFHVHAFNTWRVTDVTAKLALILEGLGWGGLPTWLVEDHVRNGRLVELSLEPYPPIGYAINSVRTADAPYGPATSWLVDRFEQELRSFDSA